MSVIRVQVADDHDVVRWGLQTLLEREPDLKWAEPAIVSGTDYARCVEAGRADVLVQDLRMPGLDVFTELRRLTARGPKPRVLVITAQADPLLVQAAAERGAAGYLLKEEALSAHLATAVRAIARGQRWYSPLAADAFLPGGGAVPDTLTAHERDILRLMAEGLTPNAMAARLGVSTHNVYRTQAHLREQHAVQSNEHLMALAFRQHWVPVVD